MVTSSSGNPTNVIIRPALSEIIVTTIVNHAIPSGSAARSAKLSFHVRAWTSGR